MLRDGLKHGYGREWLLSCRLFIGEWQLNRMHKGELYEMQPDSTYNLYSVQYDFEEDREVMPDD